MEPLKLGVIGLGTVASGVVKVLAKNQQELSRRITRTPIIEKVFVRSLDRDNPHQLPLTTNIDDIISNNEISVVIELIGGIEPARTYIQTALQNGKSVITANKELIAKHGNELLAIAAENNVFLRFEAAVAGGIPILKALREGLAANSIDKVMGIINGTTNYILTEMSLKGSNFADCLKDAQALGYAEADPTFDVEGIDAAHKLTILAATAFGTPLHFKEVTIKGISEIDAADIAIGKAEGYTIKHLGIAEKIADGLSLTVNPTYVPLTHAFANVNGVLNGIFIQGNAVGEQFMSGRGAGSEATASAVIADLIEIINSQTPNHSSPALAFKQNALINLPFINKSQIKAHYLISVEYTDNADSKLLLSEIKSLVEKEDIDVSKIKLYNENQRIIIISTKIAEENVENLINSAMLNKGIKSAKFIPIEMF